MPIILVLALAAGSLVVALAAQAHHGFSSEFNGSKPIELKGVVTKVEWANPHVYFYIDVKDSSGKVVNPGLRDGGAWPPAPPRLDARFPESGRSEWWWMDIPPRMARSSPTRET